MKYAIAFSNQPEVKLAIKDISSQIESENLSFLLYFCDIDRFAKVTEEITQTYPNIQSIGASSYIVFTSKGYSKIGIGALAIYNDSTVITGILPDISVFPLQYIQNVIDCVFKLPKTNNTICFEVTSAFRNAEERVLDTLHKALGEKIPVFGGTAGNDGSNETTYVAHNSTIYPCACVFALINLDNDFFINMEHIFKPTESVFSVTDADPNKRTIYKLDDLPAAETLANTHNITTEQLPSYLQSHPLGHIIADNQYIIEPVNFSEDGSISFFAQVFKHSRIAFFERDDISKVFQNTANTISDRVSHPTFTLAVNCMARTKYLESNNLWNMLIRSLNGCLGDYVGFSGYGEQHNTNHFNQTLVTATFSKQVLQKEEKDSPEYTDSFTGIDNEKGFIKHSQQKIESDPDNNYLICVFNINNFRVINDTYGFDKGDDVIRFVANYLKKTIHKNGAYAHIHSNCFAFCIPYTIENMEFLSKFKYLECSILDIPYQLTLRAGICNITEICQGSPDYSDIRLAIDYATIAQSKIANTAISTFYFYNEHMRASINVEMEVTSKMREALYNKEFQLYFQPQYNHTTGALVGCEALCRWVKPEGTIISPAIFIPIFERNGFIQELDKYIWDRTFAIVSSWLKRGLEPVPVSTNISRISLRNPGLAEHFARLSMQHNVDKKLVHLEFTESSYMDNQEQISATAKALRQEGFLIAMDDFGSGYSSLNTLKDVPIDILKFDMGFVKGANASKGGTIMAALVRMAQNLNLTTIVEGVEDIKTADYLQSIGSDIIQGYLYSEPIPLQDYENLLTLSSKKEIEKIQFEKELNFDDFFNPDSTESQIFNDYIGPAAIFSWENGKIEISRVYNQYLKSISLDSQEVREIQKNFFKSLTSKSKDEYIATIEETIKTKRAAVCISERHIKGHKEPIWIKSQLWCISSIGKRHIIYALIDNVSNLKIAENKALESNKRMEAIIDSSPVGVCLFSAKMNAITFTLKPIYVNKKFCDITNYTKEQLFNFTTKDFLNIIDKKDIPKFLVEVPRKLLKQGFAEYTYYAYTNDHRRDHVKLSASLLPQEDNTYFIISNFTHLDD